MKVQIFLLLNFSMFFIYILLLTLPIVISVAFYTLAERKIIASIQRRTGPNVVGAFGVLQPFADALKALVKEQVKPLRAVFYLFLFAPIMTFFISLLALNFICFKYTRSYFDEYLNFLFFFSISSFNVFGIVFAGWTSNSKYTMLGALRAAAQTFSFEMCFITLLLPIFLLNSTFNFIDIVIYQQNYWNCFVFFPIALYFFIVLLAETNRTPFDLPEAEAELVAGYNLEYSSINFALFFLGEYTNMLLNSAVFIIFFFGGWLFPFFFKSTILFVLKIILLIFFNILIF
jgi:NADH-quinone oxidoreductase subunit H